MLAGIERSEHVMLGNNCTQFRRFSTLGGRPGEWREVLPKCRQGTEQKGMKSFLNFILKEVREGDDQTHILGKSC